MRLVPGHLHGRDRAKVQTLNVRRLQEFLAKRLTLRNGRDYQRWTNLAQRVRLWHLNYTSVWAQELAIGERMGKRIAANDSRPQVLSTFESDPARAVAILGGHLF